MAVRRSVTLVVVMGGCLVTLAGIAGIGVLAANPVDEPEPWTLWACLGAAAAAAALLGSACAVALGRTDPPAWPDRAAVGLAALGWALWLVGLVLDVEQALTGLSMPFIALAPSATVFLYAFVYRGAVRS